LPLTDLDQCRARNPYALVSKTNGAWDRTYAFLGRLHRDERPHGKHGGPMRICKMIMDDIDQAYQHKDSLRVARLKVTLKHFIEAHQKEIAEDGL
jgi:hypothetical protein